MIFHITYIEISDEWRYNTAKVVVREAIHKTITGRWDPSNLCVTMTFWGQRWLPPLFSHPKFCGGGFVRLHRTIKGGRLLSAAPYGC